jgi:hypothetical protein
MLFYKNLVFGPPHISLGGWQGQDNPSIKNWILHPSTTFAKAAPVQHRQLPFLGPAFSLRGSTLQQGLELPGRNSQLVLEDLKKLCSSGLVDFQSLLDTLHQGRFGLSRVGGRFKIGWHR